MLFRSFVPADVVKYNRWRLDGRKTWDTLEQTLNNASPQLLAYLNFALAAAKVRLLEYNFGTILGVIPRTALATYAAAKLEQLRFKDVGDIWYLVFAIVATLIVCIILGILGNRALRQVTATPS